MKRTSGISELRENNEGKYIAVRHISATIVFACGF